MKHFNYALDRIPAAMLGMAIAFLLKADAPHDWWYYFSWLITVAWAVFVFGGSKWLDHFIHQLIRQIFRQGEP